MKLLDEKLVEEAAKEYDKRDRSNEPEGYTNDDYIGFKYGVSFAEQQLKEKMIEFAEWCLSNVIDHDSKSYYTSKDFYNVDYSMEQILEQFLNKE